MKEIISINTRMSILKIFFYILLVSSNLHASSEITENNIRDAITGRVKFDEDVLKKLDLNNDNMVNSADLIKYFKSTGLDLAIANFKFDTSSIKEHDGNINVEIEFDREFIGNINIELSGTAEQGIDYQSINKTIFVNGRSAIVNFKIIDDNQLENNETIIISLENDKRSSQQFFLGVPHNHTLIIDENDNSWKGALEVKNMSIGFNMELKRINDLYLASFKSDGSNCIPKGTWPATVKIQNKFLRITVDPINTNKTDSLFNTIFSRQIELESNPDINQSHIINLDSLVTGKMVERIKSTNRQYLNTLVEGTFTLIKQEPQIYSNHIHIERKE